MPLAGDYCDSLVSKRICGAACHVTGRGWTKQISIPRDGGLIATLLDTAMGVAVSTRTPDGFFAVTAQLNVHFIRPAWEGERLEVIAEVAHQGTMTAVARAEVWTDHGVQVAIGSGTFSHVRDPNPGQDRLEKHPDSPND